MKKLKKIFEQYKIYNNKGELFPLLETELGKELFEDVKQSCQVAVSDSLLFICGDCGKKLKEVRPGKHQCDNMRCKSNDR